MGIGARVTIRPAFNSETHERDIWDEIAGCSGVVTRINRDDTAEVMIGAEEYNVHLHRIRWPKVS